VILVVLALLVCGVWGFGGFKKRTDIQRQIAPGQAFTTGPYEFSFTEATVQQTEKYGIKGGWEVIALGQGRTTGKESISPSFIEGDSGMFALKDPGTGRVAMPFVQRFGNEKDFKRRDFTPGLPPVPYALIFQLDANYRPGPVLRFGVSDLIYGSHFLTTEEKVWHNGTYLNHVVLPVRVLPPSQY
jgi:hypothetical protein